MRISIDATNHDFGSMPAHKALEILLEDQNKRTRKDGRAKNYEVMVEFADGTADEFIVEASTRRKAKASMLEALEELESYRS